MKLKFSDNLRKLRHAKKLTQEQLAELLCVSFQSVSRWETGVTYPDIALLPVIADFFGTTVDALLGAEKTENGRAPEECYDQLGTLIDSGAVADVLCFLRKVHRDYPKDQQILSLLCRELRYYNTEHDNELLKEQRRLTDELLSQDTEKGYREMAVMDMVQVEPDDTLFEELLNRYSTEEDMRRMKLLEAHSYSLKQWDRYEPIKQLIAWRGLTEDLFDRMICEYPSTVNVYHSLWASEKRLSIINLLTECQSHSVAAGDGVPDLWYIGMCFFIQSDFLAYNAGGLGMV